MLRCFDWKESHKHVPIYKINQMESYDEELTTDITLVEGVPVLSSCIYDRLLLLKGATQNTI